MAAETSLSVASSGPWSMGWDAVGSIATGGAAFVALMIWLADRRSRIRARAFGISTSIRWVNGAVHLVVANSSDMSAYRVLVTDDHDRGEPLFFAVVHAGETERVPAGEHFVDRPGAMDDGNQTLTFTIDGRRWRVRAGGRLRRAPWWTERIEERREKRRNQRLLTEAGLDDVG